MCQRHGDDGGSSPARAFSRLKCLPAGEPRPAPGRSARSPARRGSRRLGSPFSRPRPRLLEVHPAGFPMAGRGAVAAFRAVAGVPVLGPCVAETVAVHVAEIPGLVWQDRLVAAGAVVETGLDRGSQSLSLSAVRLAVLATIGLALRASPCRWPVRHLSAGREIDCGGRRAHAGLKPRAQRRLLASSSARRLFRINSTGTSGSQSMRRRSSSVSSSGLMRVRRRSAPGG